MLVKKNMNFSGKSGAIRKKAMLIYYGVPREYYGRSVSKN